MVGESQILGQVKTAYGRARAQRHLGATLSQLFDYALAAAKDIRHRTGLNRCSSSFAGAALRLAGRVFENPREKNVLFIGTGEMVGTTARQFSARGLHKLCFAGRSPDKAAALAEEMAAQALPLAAALKRLHEYDIIVSCTAGGAPIVRRDAVADAIRRRRNRALCLVDLALPRDIEPGAADLKDVYLFGLNHLADAVAENQSAHQAARTQAIQLIEDGVRDYRLQTKARTAADLITTWRREAEATRAATLAKAAKQLDDGAPPAAVVEQLSKQLTNKLMHPVSELLRHAAVSENKRLLNYLRECFQPNNEDKS